MAELTDIKDLESKVDNDDQIDRAAEVADDEKLTAKEFVNKIVKPIEELQEEVMNNVVRKVTFNGTTYAPVDGVVEFSQSGSVDTYGVSVAADTSTEDEIIIKKGSERIVNLRYSAMKISTIGETTVYNDVTGTMVISRTMKGSASEETLYTQRGIVAVNKNSTEYNVQNVNLSDYCKNGSQTIKITFSTTYTQNGSTNTISGSVVFNVNVIDLAISCTQDYLTPLDGSSGQLPTIKFNVSGAVVKYLHVEVSGSTQKATYTNVIDLTEDEGLYYLPAITDTDLLGVSTHGVHTVKAWLTCDDGTGSVGDDQKPNGITSDTCIARLMVLNSNATDAQLAKVYLLMQETISSCDNYTQVHLTDFAVWKSSADDIAIASEETFNIKVLVTDYSTTDAGYTATYGELNFIDAKSATEYSADCMIEIESDDETETQFTAYMRILRETESGYENMISVSGLLQTAFVGFSVANNADYAPTSGATFYLNPKSRSNSEEDWDQIKNARNNNSVVATTVTNMSKTHAMWQKDDDSIGVLRVLAGETVEITGEEADAFYRLFQNGRNDLSIEIDYKVNNATEYDEPIIAMTETYDESTLGLELRPQEIRMMCKGSQDEIRQSVRLRENQRTHLLITLNHEVDPSDDDLSLYDFSDIDQAFKFGTMALCRIYVNGKCNKAFIYSTDSKVWQANAHGTKFVIGQANTDIDIYGIRIYEEALTSEQIKQNYVAAQTSTEEKDSIVNDNKIVDSKGHISKTLVENNLKRNTLTLHSAKEQWKGLETAKQACYVEIHIYDRETGDELLDQGGTICKQAYEAYLNNSLNSKKCLMEKSQGSTANTYAWHNWQCKTGDVTFVVNISVTKLHDDFGWSHSDSNFTDDEAATYPLYYNGEQITGDAYDEMSATEQAQCTIDVIDGWFDWNGMYHGQFWKPSENGAKAQKLCNKINYASSMVSHKMGMTSLFNDVMKEILSKSNMLPVSHTDDSSARFAVEEQPFFYFHQSDENDDAAFHGFSTFGSAKGDKPTWGYNKKKYPNMCMFEGADNNTPLSDFRIPFDDDIKSYWDDTKEDWSFALNNQITKLENEKQIGFDLGIKAGDKDGTLTEDIDKEAPWADIVPYFRQFCNLFYTHNTRLTYWNGTFAELQNYYNGLNDVEKNNMVTQQYWCTSDYHLYRFNFTSLTWVDAGVWVDGESGTGYYKAGVRDLSTDSITATAYETWIEGGTYDYETLNTYFRQAIANHFVSVAQDYICVDSFLTHYNLVNALAAGTDNCSKNTYFVYAPVTINGVMVYRWYWFADDLDTIFATDNNGEQTKEWWLMRMSDIQDSENGYKDGTDYEGNNSAMFNLCEDAYDDNITRVDGETGTANTTLQLNMKKVLDAMQGLVSSADDIKGFTAASTLMACWHKYFLQYSIYFPIVAFNECGRIRYEYPQAWGYSSMGNGARNVSPITQQLGDQRECEIDYLEKRSILFAQYAGWGDAAGKSNTIGTNESSKAFGAKGNDNLGSLIFSFTLKSDRPFYPTATSGSSLSNPHVRVMPGQEYSLEISANGDQGCELECVNFYTEIGNFGDALIAEQGISIMSSHLRKLELTSSNAASMAATSIALTCANLEEFHFGCPGYKGSFDLSDCLRLKTINIEGSSVKYITIPTDTAVEEIKLNDSITDITIADLPKLQTFSCESYDNVISVDVDASNLGEYDSYALAYNLYSANKSGGKLTSAAFKNVAWGESSKDVPIALVMWLANLDATLSGKIDSSTLTATYMMSDKLTLINKYGDIDSETNSLYLLYKLVALTSISIAGDRYIYPDKCTQNEDETYKYDGYSLSSLPPRGNNIAIKDGKADITWTLESNAYGVVNNANTGELKVSGFSAQDMKYALTVTANLMNGTTLTATANIGFYRRIPKLGDFAYLDGTFDDEYDDSRDLAGIVYARLWYQYNPDEALPSGVTSNPILSYELVGGDYVIDTKAKFMKLFIVSKEYMSQETTDQAATPIGSSMAWGLYNDNSSGSNGFSATEMEDILSAINEATEKAYTSIFNVPELTESSGTPVKNPSGSLIWYAYADCIQDDVNSETFYKYGGFRCNNTPQGGSSNAMKDWNGKSNTQKIVNWVNNIIYYYLEEKYGATEPTTLQELADLMYNVLYNKVGDGQSKYYQFAFPAAYACKLYEPTQNKSTIDDQYKCGNWYLSSIGELTRMYHHFNISRKSPMTTSNTSNNSNVPSADYASYDADQGHEGVDAWNPIFAKAYKRISSAGGSSSVLTNLSASDHWSSSGSGSTGAWIVYFGDSYVYGYYSKYKGYSVRPVVAYMFEL